MKMKNYILTGLFVLGLFPLFFSCSEKDEHSVNLNGESSELRISVSFPAQLRLAELPNSGEMSVDHLGLKNVGLYVYYSEDYHNNDLTKPYIRNMECEVVDGELRAVLLPGQEAKDAQIYIYNEMTVVAFYPYNPDAVAFTTRADEEKYVITKNDYSQQYYIPYRAQTDTDPTIAYYTVLNFYPKHTYKLEVVVVSDDAGALSNPSAMKILPATDPVGNPNIITDGAREKWYDQVNVMPDGGGGSNVWQFVTYLWTTDDDKNNIKKGDILLEGESLTLIASQDLTVDEQYVYRYGYNMTTGEIFIPTSSRIIHDIPTLQGVDMSGGTSYQACDIEVGSWTPIAILGGRYDGGGHKIIDMNVNSSQPNAGLFSQVRGNTTVCNVVLENPVVTVNSNNASVGALAGTVGNPISDDEIQSIIGNLPPGLSPTVKQALIDQLTASARNTTTDIVACKVVNPTITVNGTGGNVGSLCGEAGSKTANGTYLSRIWDSYVTGGSITAPNATNTGGFCGLNQGTILRSYTTTNSLNPAGEGFATMGTDFTPAEGGTINNCFSELTDSNAGVQQFSNAWPSWGTYTDKWPVKITGWLGNSGNTFWYNNGSSPDRYPEFQWDRK